MNLIPVKVEDWTLYNDGDLDWMKDVDLAVRAGKARARDIRPAIESCIADKLIFEAPIGARSARANETLENKPSPAGGYYRKVTELVTSGKGRTLKVTVYYLDREAALHVIMRLRTPKAIELQIAVVRVFLLAVDGELGGRSQRLAEVTSEREAICSRLSEHITAAMRAGDLAGAQLANRAQAVLLGGLLPAKPKLPKPSRAGSSAHPPTGPSAPSSSHSLEVVRRIVDTLFSGNVSAAARAIGIPQSQLNDLLRGKRGLGLRGMERVAKYAGVTLDELVGKTTLN